MAFAGDHDRLRDALPLLEGRFDLGGLDSKAADLELAVGAAQELEWPVVVPADQIPGAVHSLAR